MPPKKGLGAVILQDSRPVMFASWVLTGADKNYQNLDRECLAMIWGMEKFHSFLYGKQFTLETDQKPLVSIYKKTYGGDFPKNTEIDCEELPIPTILMSITGEEKDIPLADVLSRVTPTLVEEDGIQPQIVAVNSHHPKHSCEFH